MINILHTKQCIPPLLFLSCPEYDCRKRKVVKMKIVFVCFCCSITLSVALPKSSRRSSVSECFFSSESLHTGTFFVPFSEIDVFSPFGVVDFGFLWILIFFMDKQTSQWAISYATWKLTYMSFCRTRWRVWSIAVQCHKTWDWNEGVL